MTIRLANCLVLALFLLAGAYVLYQSYHIATAETGAGLQPVQFPAVLGGILLLLCAIELVRILLSNAPEYKERLAIPNAGKLAITCVLTGIYFVAWWATGQFYPATAVFFLALVLLYRQRITLRSAVAAVATAVLFTSLLYLVFGLAFGIRLG